MIVMGMNIIIDVIVIYSQSGWLFFTIKKT